jgi:hypothetical protein
MTKTRENYQISAGDLNGIVLRLNSILSRISDRLDKMEGLRGELETESGTFNGDVEATGILVSDTNDTQIHSME